MFQNLIVIATNNGIDFLPELLLSLHNIKCNYDIAIVDTGSTDYNYIQYLQELQITNNFELNVKIYMPQNIKYDTGAYLFAIKELPSHVYYFLHDSMKIKSDLFFELINSKLTHDTIVPLLTFGKGNDSSFDIQFLQEKFENSNYNVGIFGPIFSASRECLNKLPIDKIPMPCNKNEQMAMERYWAKLFELYNINIIPLEGDYNRSRLSNDDYSYFVKQLPCRL